ncbi:MAG: T9SS type A sorting domain-containing protein, partial [Phaeodactylibacter sp.]|nr:T9SS type A sorting domain-containing protein [Phaeodactylibacter sp.]
DPLNPFEVLGGFGPNSELAMPGYVQPWEINYDPNIPHGTIEEFSIMSTNLNATHSVQVYLPPSYADHPDRYYPSLYMHDGHEYVSLASADNILDNLIETQMISELIVVFVRPNNREEEYADSKRDQYRLFIAEELVDYIDDHYRTVQSPGARGVAGTSFGGNISALIAYNHPDVFGKMGIHSGALWPNNDEALDLWVDNPVVDVQIASVFGTLETSIYYDMTYFYDALSDKGYSIYSNFYPEGHSWGLWRATYDEILIELFPPGLTGLDEVSADAQTFQVFPNPVIGNQLKLNLPAGQVETLRITNSSGQLVATYPRPEQQFTLPDNLAPGLYTLEAIGKDKRWTTKFIIP